MPKAKKAVQAVSKTGITLYLVKEDVGGDTMVFAKKPTYITQTETEQVWDWTVGTYVDRTRTHKFWNVRSNAKYVDNTGEIATLCASGLRKAGIRLRVNQLVKLTVRATPVSK